MAKPVTVHVAYIKERIVLILYRKKIVYVCACNTYRVIIKEQCLPVTMTQNFDILGQFSRLHEEPSPRHAGSARVSHRTRTHARIYV